MNQNELEHFGIQGMKWGVRRYQNEDGSLTEAGKKRYGVESLDTRSGNFTKNSSNKQKAKLLNEYDHAIAYDKRLLNDAVVGEAKYRKKAANSRNTEKRDANLRKANQYKISTEEMSRRIKSGEDKVNSIIKAYSDSGLTIHSKEVNRCVSDGREIVAGIIESGIMSAILLSTVGYVAVSMPNKTIKGKSYKVKYKTQ